MEKYRGEKGMKSFALIGNRTIKTGIAVLLTAWLCELLHWPPVFAVITAIVTVEPTVADSIKKGIVRFPASAIGSFYAVLFISLFGNSPLTYTLAAVLTIATCFRLKLFAGLLVATLTSVAMVEVIHDNFVVAFFIRLGTTTIGLAVSTLVNMFILPPDYRDDISHYFKKTSAAMGKTLTNLFRQMLENLAARNQSEERNMLENIDKHIEQLDTFIRFQQEENKYHPLLKQKEFSYSKAQGMVQCLRRIRDHLDNLIETPVSTLSWTAEEKKIIIQAAEELGNILLHPDQYEEEHFQETQQELMELFWEDNEELTRDNEIHPTKFPPELIVLYELISIYGLVERLILLKKKKEYKPKW